MASTSIWQVTGDQHKFVMKITPPKPLHHLSLVRDWVITSGSSALLVGGLLQSDQLILLDVNLE